MIVRLNELEIMFVFFKFLVILIYYSFFWVIGKIIVGRGLVVFVFVIVINGYFIMFKENILWIKIFGMSENN